MLDTEGRLREWLEWPVDLPASAGWDPLVTGVSPAPLQFDGDQPGSATGTCRLFAFRFSGVLPPPGEPQPQTLLAASDSERRLPAIWIGLTGSDNRLTVFLSPAAGRSPHHWYGPSFPAEASFDVQVAFHSGMSPGGILWRMNDETPWSSMAAASPWGAERLRWPARLIVGYDQRGTHGRPFRGKDLHVFHVVKTSQLSGWSEVNSCD